MAAHSAEELLPVLLGTDLLPALFEDRLNLQQRTLLAYPGMITALSRHLELPPSDNLEQFRKDYNRKYYTKFCSSYLSPYQCFNKAAEYGDLVTVKSYVEQNLVQNLWDGIFAAAKNNHSEVVEYLLPRNPESINFAINGAIDGNQLELFNSLIARHPDVDYNYLLVLLVQAGDANAIAIVSRVIELIGQPPADRESEFDLLVSEVRKKLAIHARDLETLKVLSANHPYITMTKFIDLAAEKNYPEIIDYLLTIDSSANTLGYLIYGAVAGGHLDLVNQYGGSGMDDYVKLGMEKLVEQNRRDVIDILLQKYPNVLNSALEGAVVHNNRDLLQHFLNIQGQSLGSDILDHLIEIAEEREDTQDLVLFFGQLNRAIQEQGIVEIPTH